MNAASAKWRMLMQKAIDKVNVMLGCNGDNGYCREQVVAILLALESGEPGRVYSRGAAQLIEDLIAAMSCSTSSKSDY